MDVKLIKQIRFAIKSGDLETLTKIFSENSDAVALTTVFGNLLHEAACHGQLDIVKHLIEEHHFDINARGGVADSSALDEAATNSHYEIVEYLLDKGAFMDTEEPERNPLFGAILGGNVEIAKLLISRGINTQIKYTGDNMTNMDALGFARERGASEFVKLLQE